MENNLTRIKNEPVRSIEKWITYLKENMQNEPGEKMLLEKLSHRFTKEQDLNANDLLYWLYESIYTSMGWRKRHIEEGELAKAAAELDEIEAAGKAVSLLTPLTAPLKA